MIIVAVATKNEISEQQLNEFSIANPELGQLHYLETGIGKVNATFSLTRKITELPIDAVINLGTAGTTMLELQGKIINSTKFFQRDMDVTALGVPKYHTLYEDVTHETGIRVHAFQEYDCYTGDSFLTDTGDDIFPVIEMEAYAMAKVCSRLGIPFISLKYISDAANEEASETWVNSLTHVQTKLLDTLYEALNTIKA